MMNLQQNVVWPFTILNFSTLFSDSSHNYPTYFKSLWQVEYTTVLICLLNRYQYTNHTGTKHPGNTSTLISCHFQYSEKITYIEHDSAQIRQRALIQFHLSVDITSIQILNRCCPHVLKLVNVGSRYRWADNSCNFMLSNILPLLLLIGLHDLCKSGIIIEASCCAFQELGWDCEWRSVMSVSQRSGSKSRLDS